MDILDIILICRTKGQNAVQYKAGHLVTLATHKTNMPVKLMISFDDLDGFIGNL